ncbi:uncharacterized protein [Littorina saxatilis]|uniref:Uncharacterized protein n=1 Tax=Littorina saxatilis TaxID=31220 RepID=A0AAN9G4D3_9CAEN
MAKIILASSLCLSLLIAGAAAANDIVAGQVCVTTDDCVTTAVCENFLCKIKAEEACANADTDPYCIANAECPATGTNTDKCTCEDDYPASEDNTTCGTMGIAASMLMVVATFVTSRFL